MAEAKQPQLNGAYYGPAIPPQASYYRPRRGRGCGDNCCCCLLNLIFKIIITAVIIIGLAALVIWLVLRPNRVKFHVTDASLTQFNLTTAANATTLYYNLDVNITIRNPNKRIGIYYDRIEASAYYEDQRLTTVPLTAFYQGHKNTSTLNPVFKGQNLVVLSSSAESGFNSEKNSGIYSIDVKLNLRVRFKFGKIKTRRIKPKVECDLKVPLTSNGNSAGSFQTTKCDIDF